MSFSTVLILWIANSLLALGCLGAAIAYAIRRMRLPEACRYHDLAARIATKSAELSDMTARLDEARSIIVQSDQARIDMTESQAWLTKNKDLLLTVEGERKQQEVLQAQIGTLQEEISTKRSELDRVSSERATTQAAVDGLKQEHQTLADQLERSKADGRDAEVSLQKARAEVAAAGVHLETLQRNVAEQQQEVERRRSAIADLTTQHDALIEQIRLAQLEARTAAAESTQARQQAEVDKAALQASLAAAQAAVDAAQERGEVLRRESSALNARNEELQRDVLASEKAAAKAEELRVQAEAMLQKTRTEHRALAGEVAGLTGTRDGLLSEIKELRELVADLRGVLKEKGGDDLNRYKDLWEPITSFSLIKSDAAREQTALENTQKHLHAVGLAFPPRVLNAFHTALKTADMSPLVVLAGISGTGKSKLPKRYAEGMGINFVSLAVQPGWDSPQDLFGFFNHLEKRYKATELARAMVQFERHTWKSWPEAHRKAGPLSDQMLMVLLDEMNLARVEYYFSEFLSRLEERRDVRDPRDEKSRAQTEIRLDMGALAEGEREIRLYPDRNILFTGTMNEDESTQTLSDKVLDRAGVLRFGRPRTLVAGGKVADEQHRSRQAISVDQWMSWAGKPLSDGAQDHVRGWIDQLNDCMDLLHRPFAHRVAQAMQQYVVNYPASQTSDERTRLTWAMSDQIEQRILPKLRGLDLDLDEHRGPLDGIAKLIDSVGDVGLKAAFEKCRVGSIFMWRGMDRTA